MPLALGAAWSCAVNPATNCWISWGVRGMLAGVDAVAGDLFGTFVVAGVPAFAGALTPVGCEVGLVGTAVTAVMGEAVPSGAAVLATVSGAAAAVTPQGDRSHHAQQQYNHAGRG